MHEGAVVLGNGEAQTPTLAWSDFARDRCVPGGSHTWFAGAPDELLARVRAGWAQRRPGQGRAGLDEVVVVPVDPAGFVGTTVLVAEGTPLRAELTRRRPDEEPYLRVLAAGPREPVRHAAVVLYSAATLLQDGGRRSSDADWEIVALLAGPVPDEPMDPLTMARNFLRKPGGTHAAYTAEQFAAAIWHWARRAAADPAADQAPPA